MDVLLNKLFATNMLAYEEDEVPAETVDKFEEWIHSLVIPTKKQNDFNDV